MLPRRRALGALAVASVAVASVALAGCGAEAPRAESVDALQRAVVLTFDGLLVPPGSAAAPAPDGTVAPTVPVEGDGGVAATAPAGDPSTGPAPVAAARGFAALADAPAATTKARSARFVVRVATGSLGTGPVTIEGDGVVNFRTGAVAMTIDLAKMIESLGQEPSGRDLSIEYRVVEGIVYVKLPRSALPPEMDPTFQWFRVDKYAPRQFEALLDSQIDPIDGLRFLEGASADGLRELGEEPIDGASATHYRGVLDLQATIERAAKAFPNVGTSVDEAARVLGRDLPFDAWIDADGRVRKMAFALSRLGVRFEVEYTDFGVAADISAPPPSITTDLSALR